MKLPNKKAVWMGIAVAGILAAALVLTLLLDRARKAPIPESTRPVIVAKAMTVSIEELPLWREASGLLSSALDSTLAGKGVGLVQEIRVREGDAVHAGQVLIVLDSKELEAQLAAAEAELENAKIHFERLEELYKKDSVSRQELDNARRTFNVAEASQKAAEANLADKIIRAPFDGVVTEKMIEVGESSAPGRPLIHLVDSRQLRLEANVSENDIAYIQKGDRVEVRIDALGGVVAGRVAQILPSADPQTHSILVKVDLPPHPGIKSGLYGRMIFQAGSKKSIVIPQTSVRSREGLSRVYVVNETGVIQSRLVQTGTVYEDRVEILSGLETGEMILLKGEEGVEGAQLRNDRENQR